MIEQWASRLQCDRCKAKSPAYLDGSPPPGWLHGAHNPLVIRPDGVVFNDLCPGCTALPFLTVATP